MKRTIIIMIAVLMSMSVAAEAQRQPHNKRVVSLPPVPVRTCDDIPIGSGSYDATNAIADAAAVYLQFNDATLDNIAYQYFNSGWGGDFIAGYAIYAMIRAAIADPDQTLSTDTRFHIRCVLRDIRLHPESSLQLSCGGLGNSCAEEYMGRALAWAAHDAWFRNYNQYDLMTANVNKAFESASWTTSPGDYSFLWYWYYFGETWNVLFNHQTESPVYAMLTIGHLNHIRRIYEEANLEPPDFSSHYLDDGTLLRTRVEEILDWMNTKIDDSPPFLFMDAACGHANDPWGEVCNCADRPEPGVGGVSCNGGGIERHPHHYPLSNILSHLGVWSYLQWPWNDPQFVPRNCFQDQGYHNWVFNCLLS